MDVKWSIAPANIVVVDNPDDPSAVYWFNGECVEGVVGLKPTTPLYNPVPTIRHMSMLRVGDIILVDEVPSWIVDVNSTAITTVDHAGRESTLRGVQTHLFNVIRNPCNMPVTALFALLSFDLPAKHRNLIAACDYDEGVVLIVQEGLKVTEREKMKRQRATQRRRFLRSFSFHPDVPHCISAPIIDYLTALDIDYRQEQLGVTIDEIAITRDYDPDFVHFSNDGVPIKTGSLYVTIYVCIYGRMFASEHHTIKIHTNKINDVRDFVEQLIYRSCFDDIKDVLQQPPSLIYANREEWD